MTEEARPETPDTAVPLAASITVKRRLMMAWLALSWERIWIRLWVVGALLGLFGIVLLTDVLPSLHWSIHSLIVLGAAGGIGYAAWRRLKGFAWPTRGEARARLEATSPVTHRPLTTVEDSLVAGATAVQEWMWHLHQARARADLDRLRVKGPAPGIAMRDRFALRAAVVLALFVAVVGAGSDMGNRVWRGILPMLGADANPAAIKLWITPPEYTQLSPTYLELPAPNGTTAPASLDVPAGSKALVIVTGTRRDTTLVFDENSAPLEKLADESQRGEVELKEATRLELHQGPRTIAGWDMNWIPDQPPQISMPAPPVEAARWRLRVDYVVRDDYGIESATARVTRREDPRTPPLEFPLAMPPAAGDIFAYSSMHDLASHIWAGEEVELTLFAADHAKQKAQSASRALRLPMRVFKHPVSRALAGYRKDLYYKPAETTPKALETLNRVLAAPQAYGEEPLVHLTLLTARYRMTHEAPADIAAGMSELLWHAAVRIEDGSLVNAEQNLAAAEKALRDAIERGAPPEEIKKLLEELKQAAAEYSKARAENNADQKGFSKNSKARQEALEKAMQELQKMSEMGADVGAKEALKKLEEQLQAMRNAQDPDAANADVELAKEMMERMRELAEEQAKLLDENFEEQKKEAEEKAQGEGMEDGPQTPEQKKQASAKEAAAEKQAQSAAGKQEALRKKLEEMMKELQEMTGEGSEKMDDAEKSMADARDALRNGQWKQGVQGQAQAQQELTQGIEEASEQIMQQMLDKGMAGAFELAQPDPMKFSPLGALNGRRGGEEVDIPGDPDSEGTAQRVRVILEEIRKRSADRTRPESQQDYLRRLKKQF